MSGGVTIEHGGEALALLPERAVWWARGRTVFIADLHLGKAAAFRAGGLPTPGGGAGADLARLSAVVSQTGAARVVVLGDFMHAPEGLTDEAVVPLAEWRARHGSLDVSVVMGNHDRGLEAVAAEVGITLVEAGACAGALTMVHDPRDAPGGRAALGGHVHPGVRVSASRKGGGVRCACFWLRGDGVLVLPAFGGFTGLAMIDAGVGDRVFGVGEGAVVEVSGVLGGRGAR